LPHSFAGTAGCDDANRVEGSYDQTLLNTLTLFLAMGLKIQGYNRL